MGGMTSRTCVTHRHLPVPYLARRARGGAACGSGPPSPSALALVASGAAPVQGEPPLMLAPELREAPVYSRSQDVAAPANRMDQSAPPILLQRITQAAD